VHSNIFNILVILAESTSPLPCELSNLIYDALNSPRISVFIIRFFLILFSVFRQFPAY